MPTKEYYANHKEYMKEYSKKYHQEHQEKIKERKKEWYEQNKEQIKQYRQTDQRKKSRRISDWKQRGLISEDYDKIYEHYLNTWECDNCGIDLIEGLYGSNHKCMDHSHKTGEFRNILCNTCNINRIKYEPD